MQRPLCNTVDAVVARPARAACSDAVTTLAVVLGPMAESEAEGSQPGSTAQARAAKGRALRGDAAGADAGDSW